MKPKIWKIKGYEGSFSDDELVELIKTKRIKKNFQVKTKDFKKWIRISDSIYQFYLEEDNNATL